MTYKLLRNIAGTWVIVLETDVWIEAERALAATVTDGTAYRSRLEGEHPSHTVELDSWRCRDCGVMGENPLGLRAPCGFDFAGRSVSDLVSDLGPSRFDMPRRHAGRSAPRKKCPKKFEVQIHYDDPGVSMSTAFRASARASIMALSPNEHARIISHGAVS